MANSVVTPTQIDNWSDGKRRHLIILFSVAAGDYPAGGWTVDLSAFTGVEVHTFRVINSLAGYDYAFVPAVPAANSTYKLKVFTTANTELPAAATPAAIVADTIKGYFIYPQLM